METHAVDLWFSSSIQPTSLKLNHCKKIPFTDYRSLAHKKRGVGNGMAFWSGKIIYNLAYRRGKTHHIQDNLPSPSRRSTVSPLQVVSPGPKKRAPALFPPS